MFKDGAAQRAAGTAAEVKRAVKFERNTLRREPEVVRVA
jgi:hypothetical protein